MRWFLRPLCSSQYTLRLIFKVFLDLEMLLEEEIIERNDIGLRLI